MCWNVNWNSISRPNFSCSEHYALLLGVFFTSGENENDKQWNSERWITWINIYISWNHTKCFTMNIWLEIDKKCSHIKKGEIDKKADIFEHRQNCGFLCGHNHQNMYIWDILFPRLCTTLCSLPTLDLVLCRNFVNRNWFWSPIILMKSHRIFSDLVKIMLDLLVLSQSAMLSFNFTGSGWDLITSL